MTSPNFSCDFFSCNQKLLSSSFALNLSVRSEFQLCAQNLFVVAARYLLIGSFQRCCCLAPMLFQQHGITSFKLILTQLGGSVDKKAEGKTFLGIKSGMHAHAQIHLNS